MTGSAEADRPDGATLVQLLLADKRSAATRRAYASDLAAFFTEKGGGTSGAPTWSTVEQFVRLPAPQLALRLAAYKAGMLAANLSEATVNRRLAAVRSLLKFAHRLGYAATDGRSLIDGEKVVPYRNTRGVDLAALRRLLAAPEKDTLRGLRDAALLRLLAENALRRAEVCGLDVADFDLDQRRVMIRGKGRGTQKEPVTLSEPCAEAIAVYLERAGHGAEPSAPLFRNVAHRRTADGARLTPDGLHHIVDRYGRALGLSLTPHKLRHSAITAALDATGGDVRRVQRLSRHADLRVLTRYDDNRTDLQGEVTTLLSDLLKADE
uniref:Site-specific tyrosine recombinase slr0733 n=1 Tax=uncultured Armatimonadetes bacterium TaxID=157466 RepID=A0A6J4ISK3_9BACT|nr:Site-specific tyrosine recombinase slr0733 [uncultured Armatimonadetes bacterium]